MTSVGQRLATRAANGRLTGEQRIADLTTARPRPAASSPPGLPGLTPRHATSATRSRSSAARPSPPGCIPLRLPWSRSHRYQTAAAAAW